MIAIELVRNSEAYEPDPEITKTIITTAAREGALLLSCGLRGNIIPCLPALNIEESALTKRFRAS